MSRSKPGFAGMLTVNDIIHLIQYYYHHASYDTAKKEVETFRLEGLRGESLFSEQGIRSERVL